MGFLSHNSGSRHDRRSIKGSEDADDHLVSKTILSQKNGSLHWRPGPSKVGQKRRNMPSLLRHQQKKQTQNETNFFTSQLEDLLNP